jgi:predicted NUDIX family phosphoesterase
VLVRETEKMTGSFVPRRELATLRDAMETWSQVVYDALLKE